MARKLNFVAVQVVVHCPTDGALLRDVKTMSTLITIITGKLECPSCLQTFDMADYDNSKARLFA